MVVNQQSSRMTVATTLVTEVKDDTVAQIRPSSAAQEYSIANLREK